MRSLEEWFDECVHKKGQIMNDGGPAYPIYPLPILDEEGMRIGHDFSKQGMSLRDYYAGQALLGLVTSSWDAKGIESFPECASICYALADAMLEARKASAPGGEPS